MIWTSVNAVLAAAVKMIFVVPLPVTLALLVPVQLGVAVSVNSVVRPLHWMVQFWVLMMAVSFC